MTGVRKTPVLTTLIIPQTIQISTSLVSIIKKIIHILILLFIFITISCGKDYGEYIDETPQKKAENKDEASTTGNGDGTESGNDDEENKKGNEKDLDDQEENGHNKSGVSFDNDTIKDDHNNVRNDGSDDETTNNNGENEDLPSDGAHDRRQPLALSPDQQTGSEIR